MFRTITLLSVVGMFAANFVLPERASAQEPPGAALPRMTISGPYTHKNLDIYLIHGADRIRGKVYLTLDEAMQQKKVIVHETGDVNELAIENVSAEDVYVQSGDIVKGGRQDRTIGQDFICSAQSGKVPIAAFCVESGRWQPRGNESGPVFSSASTILPSKSLKLAAKQQQEQGQVWEQVSQMQEALNANAFVNVNSTTSPSSLQLTLENAVVKDLTRQYVSALSQVVDDKPDVIGYAFAINGKINSADIYVSHEFFLKLWPKLLNASSVEAFSQIDQDKPHAPPSLDEVRACLAQPAGHAARATQANPRTSINRYDQPDAVIFETVDRSAPSAGWIHRNYLTREPAKPANNLAPNPAQQIQQSAPNGNVGPDGHSPAQAR